MVSGFFMFLIKFPGLFVYRCYYTLIVLLLSNFATLCLIRLRLSLGNISGCDPVYRSRSRPSRILSPEMIFHCAHGCLVGKRNGAGYSPPCLNGDTHPCLVPYARLHFSVDFNRTIPYTLGILLNHHVINHNRQGGVILFTSTTQHNVTGPICRRLFGVTSGHFKPRPGTSD